MYNKKPSMILFDVGGTIFEDSACIPANGFAPLIKDSVNPESTSVEELVGYWNEYIKEVCKGLKSNSGYNLDAPLSAIIKYATMNAGLHINLPMPEQEELFDRYNSERTVLDGIPELFKALENLGIRYAIISNNAMSGDALALSIKHWLPEARPEFCLTSADILFAKPCKSIFIAAASYAHLKPEECWYCGDTPIPDVDGSSGCGMHPVLIDQKSATPIELRTEEGRGQYMAVNNWHALKAYLLNM